MVDSLRMSTVSYTHSAAGQLLHKSPVQMILTQVAAGNRASAPAISDGFYQHWSEKFIEAFYIDVFGATDYWLWFEWQHRGSTHVHGLAHQSGSGWPCCYMSTSHMLFSFLLPAYSWWSVEVLIGHLKLLQPETMVVTEDGEPVLFTKRNDGLVTAFNLLHSVQMWTSSTVCSNWALCQN